MLDQKVIMTKSFSQKIRNGSYDSFLVSPMVSNFPILSKQTKKHFIKNDQLLLSRHFSLDTMKWSLLFIFSKLFIFMNNSRLTKKIRYLLKLFSQNRLTINGYKQDSPYLLWFRKHSVYSRLWIALWLLFLSHENALRIPLGSWEGGELR